ncbi:MULTISPECIES: TolC family protein [Cyanophyceae]|uniref:TolC family protein n=1 Tax=Cyanophyceae TaxID=3028117 RepID=UPI001689B453|nr:MULTISPECIES: TolC family protein [Cyanophyceae]MBD1918218.1 TolC family protein [Phormidium sp. FACHB-77]MBD2030250.1 TolC family protein [Phormidium sp. FACHB-322]MBD2051378.1 TolC family protein [Leptolyngbya sp. FACHB-60]
MATLPVLASQHIALVWLGVALWLGHDGAVVSPALAESQPLIELPSESDLFSPRDETSELVILTLPDLLNLTLEGNRELRNQALGRIVQRQQLAAAEQTFNPRLTPTLRVDATRSRFGNGGDAESIPGSVLLGGSDTDLDQQVRLDTTLTTRLGTSFELGLTPFEGGQSLQFRVSQPLLRGFGTAVNEAPLNQAHLGETRNQLALRSTVIDTLTTAILGYNNLINAQAQVEIQTQALERRQQQLDILQALVNAGRLAPIELFDPERSLADAQRSLVDAQNQLDQANSTLLNLIGTDRNLRFVTSVDTITELFAAAATQLATYQPEALVTLALAQRTDYQQAQLQRQQQELDLLVAQDNLRWQLDAVADGTLGDGSRSVMGLVATRTFGDPQPETNRLTGDITLQQQDNTLAQLQDQIRNDVIAGLNEAQASLSQVVAAERATLNARRQLEAAQEQFRLGRGNITLFQLINQEEALVTAETNELEARIAFLNSVAQLEQTVGITFDLWATELEIAPELQE